MYVDSKEDMCLIFEASLQAKRSIMMHLGHGSAEAFASKDENIADESNVVVKNFS